MNDLTLNVDKTNIINSAQNITKMKHLNYQNNSIKESTNTEFLGLKLDKHINWNNHINHIPKISSAYFVVRIRYFYSRGP
jgi:Cft2 family RNA processing exonuclease